MQSNIYFKLAIASLLSQVLAQSNFFCSTTNTGADFSSVYAQFQSQGACAGTCAGYAFEILQGFECWCSNYFPATEVSTSLCNTECPGYDTDNCGGTLNGAFGYYQLAQASGTASASTSTAPSTAASSPSTSSTSSSSSSTRPGTSSTSTTPAVDPVTVVVTQTATPQAGTSSTAGTSAGTTSSTSTTGLRTSTTSSRTGTSATSSGAATTLQSGAQELATKSSEGFFDSPGKVAGTFVAVGLIAAALIAGGLFFCFRRRNRERSDSAMAVAALNRKTSSSSTMEANSRISQDGRSRHGSVSGLMGYGREKTSPTQWAMEDAAIVPVDQRLNPRPMLMRFDSNYSRHSLRDDEDYSRRVLTVTNPSHD